MNTTTKILFALGAGASAARGGFTPYEMEILREIVEPTTSGPKRAEHPVADGNRGWIGSVVRRSATLFGSARRLNNQSRRETSRVAA